jgi:hypothetical protein
MNNRHKENSITASIKEKYDKRSGNVINGFAVSNGYSELVMD